MGATNYHIKLLEEFAKEIDEFLEHHHKNCSLDWLEASPILYSIKLFESTTSRWAVIKCEKCCEDKVIL